MPGLKFVPNARQVATKASSMWAIYGAFIIDAAVKIVQYVEANREVRWQDAITPIALIVIGALRLIQQEALKTATEERLQAEKIARETLEGVAMTAGPPLTQDKVEAIKREAAAAAKV